MVLRNLDISCFNCNKTLEAGKPICPYCFAVQKNQYTRDQLFDYMEIYFPTKPEVKERYVNTNIRVKQRDYANFLILGILTLGIYYYYYLALSLQDLNDHWYQPHGAYESSTKNDTFTLLVVLILTNFIGVPFIQYVRYEKLRNHLAKAPPMINKKKPIKGSRIFWLYIIFDVFLLAAGAMLFIGLSSIIADRFIEFSTSGITVVFFSGAGIIFTIAVLAAFALVIFEIRWQDIFNDHLAWHYGFSRIKKRQRRTKRAERIAKRRQRLSNQES